MTSKPKHDCSHPPYQDLYIYYLKGRINPDAFLDDQAFIGNWEEEGDTFLFFKKSRKAQVIALTESCGPLTLVDHYHMTYDEWQGGALEPISVGDLHVVPPWHRRASLSNSGYILLDPGVVFGTGTHPTTRDCLKALQLAFKQTTIERVLDLGTGTGLLALAAARLGASQCTAVDLNRLATKTAMHNVRINAMSKQILVVQGDAKKFIDLSCDLMVSNIHYDIMQQLIMMPGFRQKKQFILSGLLRSQALEIERLLNRGAAKILHQWAREGIWHTFYGEHGTT